MDEIKITGKVKKVKRVNDDFYIGFINGTDIDAKYKTEYGTYVVQGIGRFSENENLEFNGNWQFNKKYNNWTFRFVTIERVKPTDDDEMVSFLQSQIFKGIGPVIAKRIVDKFKDKTLEVIENNPEELRSIQGIGAKKYKEMMESYRDSSSFNDLAKLLMPPPINLPNSTVIRIQKELGKQALEKIQEDPYVLCEKVSRIGFKTADFIAREKFDVEYNSISRIKAGIMYVLKEASMTGGHIYLPIGELYNKFQRIIPEIGLNDFNAVIKLLNNTELKIIVSKKNTAASPVMLKKYYNMEKSISEKVRSLITKSKKIKNLENYIKEIEEEIGIKYAPKQLEALRQIDKSNFFIITGGPGTGKSTIINGILQILTKNNPMINVIMMAPTGRASKRMEETTGRDAATIHRTLEFKPGSGFQKNDESPLEADVVIIDESSMIDVSLMSSLLKAIKEKTKVIIVGDRDQLPSVGPGGVLGDLIDSGMVPVVRLNEVFRQGKDSLIKVNAQNIREGITSLEYSENEFVLSENYSLKGLQDEIVNYYVDELIKEKDKHDSIEKALYNVQVLTPTRIGQVGTVALNNKIQEYINPNIENEVVSNYKDKNGEEVSIKFRVADKVMQTVNNYDKQVFNGDQGIVKKIEKEEKDFVIYVEFEDGRIVEYTKDELKGELVHAYAITIHKSQGSEYSVGIIVISSSHTYMNQRNIFYTGLTRAKQKAVVCGDQNAITRSINTVDNNKRYTLLKFMLKNQDI